MADPQSPASNRSVVTVQASLKAIIQRFVDGDDISIALANRIEVTSNDTFGDDEAMDDVGLMLASYRPGGGTFLYDEDQIALALRRVLSRLECMGGGLPDRS